MSHREPFSITLALHNLKIRCSGSSWCRAGVPGRRVSSSSSNIRILKISLHKWVTVHFWVVPDHFCCRRGNYPYLQSQNLAGHGGQSARAGEESWDLILTIAAHIKFSPRFLYIGFVCCLNSGSGWLYSANLPFWGGEWSSFSLCLSSDEVSWGSRHLGREVYSAILSFSVCKI